MSGGRGYGNVARPFFTLARRPISGTSGIALTLNCPRRNARNCSISPMALLGVFALLAAVTIDIAIGFALLGAWLVLPFAGAEAIALAVAFIAMARRMADQERIER